MGKKYQLALVPILLLLAYFSIGQNLVYAANPSIINFQGKVVNANGTNVTDGSYNFDFVLYDDITLGTPSDGVHDKWHELTKSVTVTSGVFQTSLGSATALPDFNANPSLYLAIRFNADAAGYMTPRVQLASVPYASNADKLGGVAVSALGQLASSQSWTNINTFQPTSNSTGAFAVKDQNSKGVLTVSTTAGSLILGDQSASGVTGKLVFNTSNNANAVTLQAGATAASGYTLTLPTTAPALNQCLQNDGTTIGQLIFASCGGGANTALSNLASTAVNVSILPGSDDAIDLGDNTHRWRDIFLGGDTLHIGTSTSDEGTISYTTSTNVLNITSTGTINLANDTALAAGRSLSLSSGAGTFIQTSTATTGDIHTITASSFAPAASATGNGESITVGQAAANASGNSVVNGYNAALTLNTTAVGTKDLTAFNASAATLTGCASGNCTVNGLRVATQATGALSTITQNGVNIQAVGVSAGVLNGINISGITAAGGVETAINVGSGWDTILGGTTAATNLINFTNFAVTSAGVVSGITGITMASGNITTSGTIGTAGTTTFTGGAATLSGAVSLGSVGTSNAASIIHIADTTDGTGTQLVTIGSTAKTTDIVTLQGGGAASTIVLQTAASGGIDIGVNNVASKTVNIGSVGSTAATSAINIGTSTGAAQTVIIGSTNTTSATTLQAGSGNINLSPSAGNDVVFSEGAGSNLQISASAVPTADQVNITNTGQGVTTAGINGLGINYTGGAAAVEAAAERIDLTPGGTSGGTWSGLRIVANGTGPVTGVTEYGIKLEGPTAQGAGTEKAMYIGTGWDVGLDVQSGGLNLAAMANPAVPAADNLRVYAKKVAGRMLLKGIGPSGVDYPYQPALFGNNIIMFAPNTAAVGTGSGFGTAWQSNGTASHPTPTTGVANQLHRTRYANVVTTTNQVLGPKMASVDGNQFWFGNAAGQGGFFFFTRFTVELWPANTVRLFAGLNSSVTGAVASDTVTGDVAGLWHDTTDGANVLSLVTRNNTTTTKTSIAGATLAAGQAFDFYMYAKPNDTTLYYRLDSVNSGTTLVDTSIATTLPRNTIFMGPQVQMSNGTANITVTTTGIGVNRIYVEADN